MSQARVNNLLKKIEEVVSTLYTEHEDEKNLKKNYKKSVKPQLKELLEQELPKGKVKKEKDPNAPKRPKSAYMYFVEAKRADAIKHLNKKHKDETGEVVDYNSRPTEVARYLGAQWKKLKEKSSSSKFIKKAEDDKKRYEQEKNEYVNQVSNE